MQYGDYVAEGWLGEIWLMAFFIIAVTVMGQRYDSKSAFLIASTLCMIFAIFFRIVNLVDGFAVLIAATAMLISIGFAIKSD